MKHKNTAKKNSKTMLIKKADFSSYFAPLSKYRYWLSEAKACEDRIKYLRKLIKEDKGKLKTGSFSVKAKLANDIQGLEYMLENAMAWSKILKARAKRYEKVYNTVEKIACINQLRNNLCKQEDVNEASADYITAHEFSWKHREQLMRSKLCGCFFCLKIFAPDKIEYWIDNDNTALCPCCAIDSVIGDASGYPVTKEFLKKMRENWFF